MEILCGRAFRRPEAHRLKDLGSRYRHPIREPVASCLRTTRCGTRELPNYPGGDVVLVCRAAKGNGGKKMRN